MRIWLTAVLFLLLAAPAPADVVHLTTLDGTSKQAQLTAITRGLLQGPDTQNLTLDDLQRIEPAATDAARAPPEEPAAIVELHHGRLLAKKLRLQDEKLLVDWLDQEATPLLLDGVRAVRFEPQTRAPEFEKAFAAPAAELDRIFLRDDGGAITSLGGLVVSLDDRELNIDIGGQNRVIARGKLFGLVIAQPAAAEKPSRLMVTLTDGSRLAGESLSLNSGIVNLQLRKANEIHFPWSAVAGIDIRSSRVQYLSELRPIAEQQHALVTLAWPAQRDRSAGGGPLRAGDRTYEKGLGVHALSRLTFSAAGQWDRFVATLGLDPERGARGDCIVKVLADGEELFSERFQGTDEARTVNLDISGRQHITLLVEPGAGLDMGDHVNWCGARLVKERRAD